jgi:hypothetical protein
MPHENAVLIDQWYDVGHRANRGQPNRLEQEIAQSIIHAPIAAGALAKRPRQLERDGRPAQSSERIRTSGQSGVHNCCSARQRFANMMVIRDDQRQAKLLGELRLAQAADAAVDRHDNLGALGGQPTERLCVEAVAFINSIWNVEANVGIEQSQTSHEDGGGSHPVGVIVAVDGNAAFGLRRIQQDRRSRRGARKQFRLAQTGQLGVEKLPRIVGVAYATG